ncbi:peptidase [Mycobacterium sp. pW049]|uniref:peptidase n=1 Tax=[Mycobacterium] bulgaricum TaxID=3238985 RepID=UPI00351ACCD5
MSIAIPPGHHRGRGDTAAPQRRLPRLRVVAAVAATVALAGCATTTEGQGRSSLFNPNTVGGMAVVEGPSGVRPDAPEAEGTVDYTDKSEADELALLAVNDVVQYWEEHYTDPPFDGTFEPVENLASYDSTDPSGPRLCGQDLYDSPNAFFCPRADLIAWDRGELVPTGINYFGEASIAALLAHEYGHAVQTLGEIVDRSTPVIVREQQADCFAGSYIRWVAEGSSPRFQLNTSDGLNRVLAAAITIRDPVLTLDDRAMIEEGHGTALDRVAAFQTGFIDGVDVCARIDLEQIEASRGDLPMMLTPDESGTVPTGDAPITEKLVTTIIDALNQVFGPAQPPTITVQSPAPACPDVEATPPAAYCPATNTIAVDLPALQALGSTAGTEERVLVQGDNSAISVLTSRYTLALQHERGAPIDTVTAALRTACLTGVAQRKMVEPIQTPQGGSIVLTAGDLDEAVAGLLNNGIAASDVNGITVAAGFTRITAYRSGLINPDAEACYTRFP